MKTELLGTVAPADALQQQPADIATIEVTEFIPDQMPNNEQSTMVSEPVVAAKDATEKAVVVVKGGAPTSKSSEKRSNRFSSPSLDQRQVSERHTNVHLSTHGIFLLFFNIFAK